MAKGEVYFAAGGGRIKVGFSRKTASRIQDINLHLAEPVTLIGTIPGTPAVEKAIHARLGAHKLKGEWFTDCAEVREVIDGVMQRGLDAMGITVPERPAPPMFVPSPPDPNPLPKVAFMMWGHDASRELAAMADVPEQTANEWLNGTRKIPNVVRLAFSAVMIMWAFKKE